jgi:hypothetical protein
LEHTPGLRADAAEAMSDELSFKVMRPHDHDHDDVLARALDLL